MTENSLKQQIPFQFAPSDRVKGLEEFIVKVLAAIEIDSENCFISDETSIGDFYYASTINYEDILIKARTVLGIEIYLTDKLADLATKFKLSMETPSKINNTTDE